VKSVNQQHRTRTPVPSTARPSKAAARGPGWARTPAGAGVHRTAHGRSLRSLSSSQQQSADSQVMLFKPWSGCLKSKTKTPSDERPCLAQMGERSPRSRPALLPESPPLPRCCQVHQLIPAPSPPARTPGILFSRSCESHGRGQHGVSWGSRGRRRAAPRVPALLRTADRGSPRREPSPPASGWLWPGSGSPRHTRGLRPPDI